MTIKRFTEIKAWQAARELVRAVYLHSSEGAVAKDFAFRDQIRRAAISGMSNIAEGFDRGTDRDFAHFLDISRASISEVKSLLFVGLDVQYFTPLIFDQLTQQCEQSQALIAAFQGYLRGTRIRELENSDWQ